VISTARRPVRGAQETQAQFVEEGAGLRPEDVISSTSRMIGKARGSQ
jgi:hypothetical protein